MGSSALPVVQTQEGYPLVKDTSSNEPTTRVHVFGEQWKLQGDGYEPVWFAKPKCAATPPF